MSLASFKLFLHTFALTLLYQSLQVIHLKLLNNKIILKQLF